METNDDHRHEHDDFGGLHRDLPGLFSRRRALGWIGGAGLVGLAAACGDDGSAASTPTTTAPGTTSSTTAATTTTDASVAPTAGAEIPDETAGPYPADGSNGPNVLAEDGIVRSDLTTSIGDLSGTADGVPTEIRLTVVDADTGTPLAGAAVYLWHCTAGGQYSIYEITDQNYLRGVATTDDAGGVAFTTIFPGCYAGRWPHCHFEVYTDLAQATAGSQAVKTSQLALPQADCEAVYDDARYGGSATNLAQLSLATDNVFADGWDQQLATVAGDPATGLTASLLVRV